ncbi:MAG: flippase-like domain-containing protein [Proteobacteria bacterium]|nr:flippase-like domain-containing protein [Pseudomonadota bacterium]
MTRLALLAGVIGLVVTVWAVGPGTIVDNLRHIGPWFLALFALDIVISAVDAAAIYALTRGDDAPPYSRVLVAQLAGRAVNAATPGGNLGEALKAGLLSEETRPPRVIFAVMYCGLASLCISLAMIAVGAPVTAVLLDLHAGLRITMFVAGGIAAGVVVAIVVLVRRGILKNLVGLAGRLHIVSWRRRHRWKATLTEIDERFRANAGATGQRRAAALVLLSKSLSWGSTWVTVAIAGYLLDVSELAALLSAGVVLGWVSMLVPMGIGVAEGGSYGLFALIGAPPSLGVSVAFASRVLQVLAIMLGLVVLGLFRLKQRLLRRHATAAS